MLCLYDIYIYIHTQPQEILAQEVRKVRSVADFRTELGTYRGFELLIVYMRQKKILEKSRFLCIFENHNPQLNKSQGRS